jgi:putative pyrroloquinoline-quinone binding quinoprotein
MHKHLCLVGGGALKHRLACALAVAALAVLALPAAAGAAASGPSLLSQTTWGGPGQEEAGGVAVGGDGSAYVTGLSDSFTVDAFGQPRAAIFAVKFAAGGSLSWQRIWNGPTVFGSFGVPETALAPGGSVYVAGTTTLGSDEGVVLKFDPNGNLIWQRALSAGTSAQEIEAVATGSDGAAYVVGSIIDFANGTPAGMSITKIAADGTLVWQKRWITAFGEAVAVAGDGSIYAAGTAQRPGAPGGSDLIVVKLAPDGSLVWARTYSAGTNADPRGGGVVGPDGSLYLAGAIQGTRAGIAALIVKLNPGGTLAYDRAWQAGSSAAGVAVAPNGTLYVSGTLSATKTDAFVLHLLPSGRGSDAATWGSSGTGLANGGGVGVAADGTIRLAATAPAPPTPSPAPPS